MVCKLWIALAFVFRSLCATLCDPRLGPATERGALARNHAQGSPGVRVWRPIAQYDQPARCFRKTAGHAGTPYYILRAYASATTGIRAEERQSQPNLPCTFPIP
ncbi:hypothetical protein C8Q78DRAFT_253576 [Trametes maxima]|nr:hypothetical protein C8Q78DRAFT_253576 [Trametes maxima]